MLDVDGDGDADFANTNAGGAGNVSVLINDGTGVFGAPAFFEGGGTSEWALSSADMDEDGIIDLIVGGRTSQEIIVQRGNGDGTFSLVDEQDISASVWMLVIGDVNGDGHEDVITANSFSNNGSVLMGDGTGHVGVPQASPSTPSRSRPTWATWTATTTWTGWSRASTVTGGFSSTTAPARSASCRRSNAPSNASCSLMADTDNDRDLDLCLTDEIADRVILMKNIGPLIDGDMNCDGLIDGQDIDAFLLAVLNTATYIHCSITNGDTNNDAAASLPRGRAAIRAGRMLILHTRWWHKSAVPFRYPGSLYCGNPDSSSWWSENPVTLSCTPWLGRSRSSVTWLCRRV